MYYEYSKRWKQVKEVKNFIICKLVKEKLAKFLSSHQRILGKEKLNEHYITAAYSTLIVILCT